MIANLVYLQISLSIFRNNLYIHIDSVRFEYTILGCVRPIKLQDARRALPLRPSAKFNVSFSRLDATLNSTASGRPMKRDMFS